MGISGLLPLLKSVSVQTHLREYKGSTFGVDAYVWLHRGAWSCAWDLALGKPTTKYVDYAMRRVHMLEHFGITPYVVLDGGYLPSKAKTEVEREAKRREHMRKGKEAMAMGNNKLALENFQKCVDVTPEMALRFIRALQAANVRYVVAPYEADAQLAFLEREGLVHGIVTEDSDLLVYGCRRVLFKLTDFGDCTEILRDRIGQNKELSFAGWTDDMFRYMAILSGCDYLDSIPGMGLKRAHRIVRKYKDIPGVMRAVRMDAGLRMPQTYERSFILADMTFKHQRVFCPSSNTVKMWNTPFHELEADALALIGAHIEPDDAVRICTGQIDPITKETIVLTPPRPGLKHVKSAPDLRQHGSIEQFLKPQQAAVVPEPRVRVMQELGANALNSLPQKRSPPKTVAEQLQAAKLKMFDSSPSPAQKRQKFSAIPANINANGPPVAHAAVQTPTRRAVSFQQPSRLTLQPQGIAAVPSASPAADGGKENLVSKFFKARSTPTHSAGVNAHAGLTIAAHLQTSAKRWSPSPSNSQAQARAAATASRLAAQQQEDADLQRALKLSVEEGNQFAGFENPLRFDLQDAAGRSLKDKEDKVSAFFKHRPPPAPAASRKQPADAAREIAPQEQADAGELSNEEEVTSSQQEDRPLAVRSPPLPAPAERTHQTRRTSLAAADEIWQDPDDDDFDVEDPSELDEVDGAQKPEADFSSSLRSIFTLQPAELDVAGPKSRDTRAVVRTAIAAVQTPAARAQPSALSSMTMSRTLSAGGGRAGSVSRLGRQAFIVHRSRSAMSLGGVDVPSLGAATTSSAAPRLVPAQQRSIAQHGAAVLGGATRSPSLPTRLSFQPPAAAGARAAPRHSAITPFTPRSANAVEAQSLRQVSQNSGAELDLDHDAIDRALVQESSSDLSAGSAIGHCGDAVDNGDAAVRRDGGAAAIGNSSETKETSTGAGSSLQSRLDRFRYTP